MLDNMIWLGDSECGRSIFAAARQFDEVIFPKLDLRENLDDYGSNPVGYEKAGDVAIIKVKGGTLKSPSFMTRWLQIPTYEDIADRLDSAAGDSKIKLILFLLDSSGGQASGVKKLAEKIREIGKPIISFTEEIQMSAAMWYGSACTQCVADPDAELGSIGVIATVLTYADAYKKEGIGVNIFRSVPGKQLVNSMEDMSEEGRKSIQKTVDAFHVSFVKAMSGYRGIDEKLFSENIATGLTFSAKEALQHKLIDHIMPLNELVTRLAKFKG